MGWASAQYSSGAPMARAEAAIAAGVSCLFVTLGKRGAIYVAAPGFDALSDLPPRTGLSTAPRGGTGGLGAVRTALVAAEAVDDALDPQHNAQLAFDAQVVQRVLWRLRLSDDLGLRRDLAAYLDRLPFMAEPQAEQQAVA